MDVHCRAATGHQYQRCRAKVKGTWKGTDAQGAFFDGLPDGLLVLLQPDEEALQPHVLRTHHCRIHTAPGLA